MACLEKLVWLIYEVQFLQLTIDLVISFAMMFETETMLK